MEHVEHPSPILDIPGAPFMTSIFEGKKFPKQGPNFQSKQRAHVGSRYSRYTGTWCGFRIVVSCLIYESWMCLFFVTLGIQSYSHLMIGVSNHLLSIVFRFHYHSQKVIGSLGWQPEKHSSPFPLYDMPTKNVVEPLQGGSLPRINEFTTPTSRVTFPVIHLFSAIYRGPITPWPGGPTL